MKWLPVQILFLILLLVTKASSVIAQDTNVLFGSILTDIRARSGSDLKCGILGNTPRMSIPASVGTSQYEGFDVDICRAIAAAISGDATAVNFVVVPLDQRNAYIKNRVIDILSAQTTWNFARDFGEDWSATFGPIVFYDQQDILVRVGRNLETTNDLSGETICVAASGTTSIQNIEIATRELEPPVNIPLDYTSTESAWEAFQNDECDGFTSDSTVLIGNLSVLSQNEQAQYQLMGIELSEEPLAPATHQGDQQFADIARTVIYGLYTAEALGISRTTVGTYITNIENGTQTNPDIIQFLGKNDNDNTITIGERLGLQSDFMVSVISRVGNYADIYNEHFANIPGMERDRNRLWIDGGLLYAPPWR